MGIKKGVKRVLFSIDSSIADVMYKRPYFDRESKARKQNPDKILHLDLVITECCSLKCRDCSNLMQYYQHPENLYSDDVINDLRKLFESVCVGELKILGGEPFVNQKVLCDVLDFLSKNYTEKYDLISIITNGTIIPNAECLESIKNNPKTHIVFSNYGDLSAHQDELIRICTDENIRYSVIDDSFYWFDFGQPVEYDEPDIFVRKQYKQCYNRKYCNTLYRGGIYACPRQAHAIHLGLIPDTKDEYVDLYDPRYENKDDLKNAISGIANRKQPLTACRYCIVSKYIHVKRGIQK
ncbi:MAG: radical SAM protein [Clostridiales bacterium]|nr:radical SAM protein [Clostridiales bacterium]